MGRDSGLREAARQLAEFQPGRKRRLYARKAGVSPFKPAFADIS